MLFTFACSVHARLFFIRMSRENCALSTLLLGPVMLLRPALPYWPAGGATNASGLKNCGNVSPLVNTGTPVAFARSEPLLPFATVTADPRTTGVSGVPV